MGHSLNQLVQLNRVQAQPGIFFSWLISPLAARGWGQTVKGKTRSQTPVCDLGNVFLCSCWKTGVITPATHSPHFCVQQAQAISSVISYLQPSGARSLHWRSWLNDQHVRWMHGGLTCFEPLWEEVYKLRQCQLRHLFPCCCDGVIACTSFIYPRTFTFIHKWKNILVLFKVIFVTFCQHFFGGV